MSPKEKKQFIKEVADVIETVKKYKSGKLNEISDDSLDKSLAVLKQTALKAQRKWEKMNEGKLNEDDPKKDYGGYYIKNPDSLYALRNLPPTNDPKQLKKRQMQMNIEKILKSAPTNWYDAWSFKTASPSMSIVDPDTGKSYIIGTGRELTTSELDRGLIFSDQELENYKKELKKDPEYLPKNKLIVNVARGGIFLSSLLIFLRLLLAAL